jgi:proteasome lid subunit RPN8/RPN11
MIPVTRRIQDFIAKFRRNEESQEFDEGAGIEQQYPSVVVPARVCETTCEALRSHAPVGQSHEGVAYWAGVTLEDIPVTFVTTCIVPEAETGPGHFEVSTGANARVTRAVHDNDIAVLGTVHSHPGAGTHHSGVDDDEAFTVYDGYYSVIVPDYGTEGMLPLTKCGVHRYEAGTETFRKLNDTEISSTFTTPTAPLKIDTR